MRIEGDWLDAPELRAVFEMLTEAGHRALVVGGAVRNAVMGLPVTDMDLATDARPERVMALAEKAELKAVPTGIEHGTVTVISGETPFEITTFRRDEKTFGRKAHVAFTDDLTEDARRRDFTMNALYVGPDGVVIDPVGGLDDARAGRVRFIEDAGQRIEEDYLRILRFFRFNAVYGRDGLDPEALSAIAERLDGLKHLARERVGAEMRKLLGATDPGVAVAAMERVGVLMRILPGASSEAIPPLVHVEGKMGLSPNAIRRLAALGGEAPDAALRLSRAEAGRLERYRAGIASVQGPGELAYRLGADEARDVLALRAAVGMPLPEGWAAAVKRGSEAVCPVTARDLMPEFEGPALGERLRAVEDAWIASGFTKTQEDLL
ncbi:CCA tRNA nucleotidyltransferase [Roseovarius sp. SCSIO 43702]|uniref:CCA tRNA nucleotidyltransferase n=1 Tax=Roseovarius sp. SCSIO 43702 TaxID=2823043 RepID=UPI001C739746|nr:CCA tRNA nucleotidyltransferase [Roseovarius sp. SCSIO 43702]QYX57016.1 CCA tRNA nucleotidyltransferase [Roseovarius sp. SCSIO 43702]